MSDLAANKQVARDFFAALGRLDVPVLMSLLDEKVVLNVQNSGCMGGQMTLQDLPRAAAALNALCPEGIAFNIRDLTAEDDRVCCRVDGHGKVAGGGEYNNRYLIQLIIKNGRIVETHEYLDSLLVEKLFAPLLAKMAAQ